MSTYRIKLSCSNCGNTQHIDFPQGTRVDARGKICSACKCADTLFLDLSTNKVEKDYKLINE